jgi:hypothetical protein
LNGSRGEFDGQFFPGTARSQEDGGGTGNHRRGRTQWWEPRYQKSWGTSGVHGHALEVLDRKSKCKAAVAGPILVPAFETLPSIAEKNRSRRHQLAAPRGGAVLKAAGDDSGDRKLRMSLFERTIPRAGGTDHIRHGPAIAFRQKSDGWNGSNFSQDFVSERSYNSSIMSTLETNFETALVASGRCTEIPESHDVYGWLIGSWEMEVRRFPGGVEHRGSGEVHFSRVLEGRAIQDVWIMPRRSDRTIESLKALNVYGMTLRVWDPSLQAWRVSWINPVTGARDELVGRRIGQDLVQVGAHADGTPIRWIFTDITPQSFRWVGEALETDGKTWKLEAEFHVRRLR